MKKPKATEALRVATEIAAIRAVLKERGYAIVSKNNPSKLPGKSFP